MQKSKLQGKWQAILQPELEKNYMRELSQFVAYEYETQTIYPKQEDIFRALNETDFDNVKVVLLGQDPYHRANQAMGLSFSVPRDMSLPPSLRNIYQEVGEEYQTSMNNNGDLTTWAKQGVLLLNTVLTVREGQAQAHAKKGWEIFTDQIICLLNQKETPIVFLLLGKPAQLKKHLIMNKNHSIIEAPHPSPLSAYRGFFGSGVFKKVNQILVEKGQTPIDWLSVNSTV